MAFERIMETIRDGFYYFSDILDLKYDLVLDVVKRMINLLTENSWQSNS